MPARWPDGCQYAKWWRHLTAAASTDWGQHQAPGAASTVRSPLRWSLVVLIRLLTLLTSLWCSPPNPLATPPAGLSQVWANRSHLLRFCHDTGNLTLTVRQNLRWASEESRRSDILLLRDRLRDEDFLREVGLVWVVLSGCVQGVNSKKLFVIGTKANWILVNKWFFLGGFCTYVWIIPDKINSCRNVRKIEF